MEIDGWETERERVLWMRWRAAEARIAELEAQAARSAAARPEATARPRRRPMSPDDLAQHQLRCAARARLYRRGTSLRAREGLLEQARDLDAVPAGFDEDLFLAGLGPNGRAPQIDSFLRRKGIGDRRLMVLQPTDDPDPGVHPQLFILWCALRLAHLDESLERDELEELERFCEIAPAMFAAEAESTSGASLVLQYGDGPNIARDATGTLRYPNDTVMFTAEGRFQYPSGEPASCVRTRTVWYPNGEYLRTASGEWGAPDGSLGDLGRLRRRIERAARPLWPAIALATARAGAEVIDLLVLETAWVLLRAGRVGA